MMIEKLCETFSNSHEDNLMLSAECKKTEHGNFDLTITEGLDNELFVIHGEDDQTPEDLRSMFESIMNDAIKAFSDEDNLIEIVNPAES